MASAAYWKNEIKGCMDEFDGDTWMEDVLRNRRSLCYHGMYEKYLLASYRQNSDGNSDPEAVAHVFKLANKKRLRAAGDPIPCTGISVTLYRGISGNGHAAGMSWTDDINIACLFAKKWSHGARADDFGLNPTVWTVTVPVADILVYTNKKGEREYLLDPTNLTPTQVVFRPKEFHVRSYMYGWGDDYKVRQNPHILDIETFVRMACREA